jgi:hypothetical protein
MLITEDSDASPDDGANYNKATNNTLIGGTYYSLGVSGNDCTGNYIAGNIFDDDTNDATDIYDTGTGTIKTYDNYDYNSSRFNPITTGSGRAVTYTGDAVSVDFGAADLTTTGATTTGSLATEVLQVGDATSNTIASLDSVAFVGTDLGFYDGADTLNPYIPFANREDITEKISPIYELGLLGSPIKAMTLAMKITDVSGYASLSDGNVKLVAVLVDRTISATGVKWEQYTTGDYTGDKLNGIAIFSESGGTLTLIDSCARNVNFWKETSNTIISSTFTNGPHTLTEGVYWVGMAYNQSAQTTLPTVGGTSLSHIIFNKLDFTNNRKLCGTVTVGWGWPATIDFSTVTENTTVQIVFLY